MESTRVVGGTLGACTKREGRALAVEVLRVREASFVLAFHIIPFYISLTKSLRITSTLIGAGRASGECEHEQDAEKAFQLCSRLEQVLNVPQRVRLRPVLRLRPCWEAFLSILREWSAVVPHVETIEIISRQHNFLAGC
jgi:hypothetical protein